jgi:hypothetical protein
MYVFALWMSTLATELLVRTTCRCGWISARDLAIENIITAGNGTIFSPQVIIVASTWFKVEAYYRRAGPQNTLQLVMAVRVFFIHFWTKRYRNHQ